MQLPIDGHGFRIVRELARSRSSVSSEIRYRTGDLELSGMLLVPAGPGPFPVVVLAHGYINPAVYRTGQGWERAQPRLAAAGFAVLHLDYRNHAASDRDPTSDLELRIGYIEDAIAAVHAIRRAQLPRLDTERIALVGRSMGGGVTLGALVVEPGIVDAAVLYASVSSDHADNFRRFLSRRPALVAAIIERYGSPSQAPDFWAGVSPRTYVDRIDVPMLVHHGTADDTCPIRWSDETVAALRAAGADVTYHRYRGEGHQLYAAYDLAMRRTIGFLRRHLEA